MRSYSATGFLMFLIFVVLVGAIAAPAESKRPRRYDAVVLMDWTICQREATITVGVTGTPDDTPDTVDDTNPEPVDIDAELGSTPRTSLIQGGRKRNWEIDDLVPDKDIKVTALTSDDLVTDEDPAEPGEDAKITHQEDVHLMWSQPVPAGEEFIRLGLASRAEPNSVLTWGRFRVGDCQRPGPSDTGDAGSTSPGVTDPGPPLSNAEIKELSTRVDETREVGRGEEGLLVPRSECTKLGTPGDDRIAGTSGNDVICGLGGNDVIDGAGGIDVIDGADGNDRVTGGPGDDLLLGLRGDDRLNGNSGGDKASGGAGVDRVKGSSGNDPLVSGGSGNDLVSGGQGRDRLKGGSGNDNLRTRDRTRDTVNGGSGFDSAQVDGRRGGAAARRRADRVRGVEQLL